MFVGMSLSILSDKNLQGNENAIFTLFFVMKFFGYNIMYYKLIN